MNFFYKIILRKILKSSFNAQARREFYDVLLTYAKAGMNLADYLQKMNHRYEDCKDIRKYMTAEWVRSIANGDSFAASLRDWIGKDEYMILSTVSNAKDGQAIALEKCIYILDSRQSMIEKVIPAIRTGAIYMALVTVLVWAFVTYLLPDIVSSMDEKVVSTNSFVAQTDVIREYFLWILSGIAGGVILVSVSQTWRPGVIRKNILDKLPPYSITKSYNSAMFLVMTSAMLAAGMTLKEVLEFFRHNSSLWMRYYVVRMIARHNAGSYSSGKVLDIEGFIEQDTMDLIDDYSEAGGFEKKIDEIGSASIKNAINRIEKIGYGFEFGFKMIFIMVLLWLVYGTSQIVVQSVGNVL